MFTRLLVGLDGSPASRVALLQAIELGRRFRSTILLAHIQGRGKPVAAELLAEAAAQVRGAGLSAQEVVRPGDVVEELRTLAEDVDLVLMGRVGIAGGWDPLGPDTRSFIQRTPRPVLVCGSVPSPMDRCAVAYDGRETSDAALEFAARYAAIAEAHLEVIHVSDDEPAGREVLARASGALSISPLSFEIHLEHGDVHDAVADAVRRLECNALFAGAHREEGRWLVPSHTEAILRATDIPVLIHNLSQSTGARASAAHRRPSSG